MVMYLSNPNIQSHDSVLSVTKVFRMLTIIIINVRAVKRLHTANTPTKEEYIKQSEEAAIDVNTMLSINIKKFGQEKSRSEINHDTRNEACDTETYVRSLSEIVSLELCQSIVCVNSSKVLWA